MRILNEEQQKWVDIIGEFAKKEIEPIMLDWDKVVAELDKRAKATRMRRHSSWA